MSIILSIWLAVNKNEKEDVHRYLGVYFCWKTPSLYGSLECKQGKSFCVWVLLWTDLARGRVETQEMAIVGL